MSCDMFSCDERHAKCFFGWFGPIGGAWRLCPVVVACSFEPLFLQWKFSSVDSGYVSVPFLPKP